MTFDELMLNIKIWEGFKTNRYQDAGGVPTIGYGFTASCFENGLVPATITKTKADEILEDMVTRTCVSVSGYLNKWGYSQEDIDILLYPLTDFTYNCGVGNLATLCEKGNRTVDNIIVAIVKYNKCKGKELPGLTRRRTWERDEIIKAKGNSKTPAFNPKQYTVADLQTRVNEFYGSKVLKVDNIFGKNTLSYTMAMLDALRNYY